VSSFGSSSSGEPVTPSFTTEALCASGYPQLPLRPACLLPIDFAMNRPFHHGAVEQVVEVASGVTQQIAAELKLDLSRRSSRPDAQNLSVLDENTLVLDETIGAPKNTSAQRFAAM